MKLAEKLPIKGCIFGLDGVLVDTVQYHYLAWRRVANEMGFDFPEEQIEQLRSLTRIQCLEKIIDWGGLYMTEAEKMFWSDLKNNWYKDLIVQIQPTELLPGVLPFFQELKKLDIAIAIVSDSQNAAAVIKSLQIESFVSFLVNATAVPRKKPHPECFLMAAQGLQLSPSTCLVFEDSPLGIQAALSGGFVVVGVGKHAQTTAAPFKLDGFANVHVSEFAVETAV